MDVLFLDEPGDGTIEFFGRNVQAEELCDMVALAVSQQGENLLAGVMLSLVSHQQSLFCQAYVTLAAVMVRFFPKVFQQHARTAPVTGLYIAQHGLYAFAILFQPIFVDTTRYLDVLFVLAALHVADVGYLPTRDEADEVTLRQRYEDVVRLWLRQSRLVGHGVLVDVAVVGKQSAVVAQQGYNDALFVGCRLFQTVEVVTAYQETYAGLVVGFFVIVDISRPLQYLQGRMAPEKARSPTC